MFNNKKNFKKNIFTYNYLKSRYIGFVLRDNTKKILRETLRIVDFVIQFNFVVKEID
jgi:hypothetical protein